jgi:hypothetical protein
MPEYPPSIADADFLDPAIPTAAKPVWKSLFKRTAYELDKRVSSNVHVCGIEELWLEGFTLNTEFRVSFKKTSGRVPSNSPQRWHFAPQVGLEDVRIHWRLSGFHFITELRLELFRRNDATALWTKTIQWAGGACPAAGETPFSGDLRNIPALCVATGAHAVAIANNLGGDFPDQCVTVEHSPYKLRATILPDPALRRKIPQRFLYFDILVSNISLALGQQETLPTVGFPAARQALNLQTYNRLAADGALPAPGQKRKVVLLSNVFKRPGGGSTEYGEMYDDSGANAYGGLWDSGAPIPIVATVEIANSLGQNVTCGQALGNVKFLWDYEDVPKDPAGHEANPLGAQYLTLSYDYDKDLTHPKGTNCHKDRGGKRGDPAASVFPLPLQTGYPEQALPLQNGVFPFAVTACANRTWAAFSTAWRSQALESKTGVVFQPSRMAGDAYKVTVYLAYDPALDGTADAPLNCPVSVQKSTGVFEVWRKVQIVGFYRKDNTVPDFAAAGLELTVQAHFLEAFMELAFEQPGVTDLIPNVLTAAQYNALAQPILAAAIAKKPWLVCLVDPAANHGACSSMFQTRSYADFGTQVAAFLLATFDDAAARAEVRNEEEAAVTASAAGRFLDERKAGTQEEAGRAAFFQAARADAAPGIAAKVAALSPAEIADRKQAMIDKWRNNELKIHDLKSYTQQVSDQLGPCTQTLGAQLDVFNTAPPPPEGITVVQFAFQTSAVRDFDAVNPLNLEGEPEVTTTAGTALDSHTGTRNKAALMLYGFSAGTMAHELGHHCFLPHYDGYGGMQLHDHGHKSGGNVNCTMTYRRPRPQFCALCQLRMRGWLAGTHPNEQLHTDGNRNRRS